MSCAFELVAKEIEDSFRMPWKPSVLSVDDNPLSDLNAHRGPFDFIYSFETFSRLASCGAARVFLASMFGMLKPGGRLLVADKAANRTEEELAGFTAVFPNDLMIGHVVFRDAGGSISFLEVHR